MSLLWLILISIFVNFSFQTAQNCDSNLQFLGQIEKVSNGVEITKLDLSSVRDNGVRLSLFELTCNQSQLWTNQNLPRASYQIPDQVLEASIKVPVSIKKSVTIYHDFRDFKKFLQNNNMDTNDSLQAVSSLSETYRMIQNNILNNCTVIEILTQIPAYAVFLNEFINVSKIENLVNEDDFSSYEQDPYYWQRLISMFGTHYFQNTQFGGTILLRAVIKNEKINEKTISSISTNLLGKYKKMFGENLTVDGSESLNVDTSISVLSHGGMDIEGQIGKDVLKNYALSVLKWPVILSGKLKPITNLIQNETIRQQVKVAIEVNQKQAVLEEQKNLLQTIKQSYHPVMDKILNLSWEVNPDESQVIAVKSEVDNLVSQLIPKILSPSSEHLKQLKESLERGVA